jgi:hypothetical protein
MRGNVHGPGGKLTLEPLLLHFLNILSSTKRKIKKAMKVVFEKVLLKFMMVV